MSKKIVTYLASEPHSVRGSSRTSISPDQIVLISEQDAAAILGVATITLRNWRLTGTRPVPRSTKLGSVVRYRKADVLAFIAERFSNDEV